ncbi:MAG: tail fiber domain-containing protein, partial [Bacteroidota bacterium]
GGYRFFTNSTNQVANGIFFAPGGNVGIGTSSPLSKLHVYDGALRISNATSTAMIYQTGTGTRLEAFNPFEIAPNGAGVLFKIDDGDLTIDVATHINNNFQLNDSTQGLNKVLRSDAQGYASWVNLSSLPGSLSNGTTNYLPKWSSSTSLSSTSLVYDNGNAVGIGTTVPSGRLEVRNTSTSGYSTELVVNSNGSTDADLVLKTGFTNMGIFGGGSTAKLGIWNYANSTELVTVLSTGNMGIGTISPGTSRLNILIPNTDASNPFGITINNNYVGTMDKYGIDVNVDGGGSGTKFGISSSVVGLAADASSNYGYQVAMTPNGTGTCFGIFSDIAGVGTGVRYGIYNSVVASVSNTSSVYGVSQTVSKPTSSTGILYGMRLNTYNDGSGSQYGIYLSNSGNTTGARYGIYSIGETSNYLASELGIGTTASYQLHLSLNSAAKPTSTAWTAVSDARLKTNIHPYTEGLNEILKINPVWFTYTGEAGMPKETGVGVIAQDLQKVAPYMVNEWTYYPNENRNNDRTADPIDPKSKPGQVYLGVDNGAMTYMLINAIKEQQKQMEEQGKQIQKLILENEKLKSEIKSIKDNSGK